MAKEFELTGNGDYQLTNTYRDASRDERRRLNRYKKENDISGEHMFYLLAKRDLANVPKDRRDGADTTAKMMLIIAVLLFWSSMSTAAGGGEGGFNIYVWLIALVSFLLVIVVYYTGILNPYKQAVRKVNKYLKDAPEVIDYETWCESHPLKG